MPLRGRPSHVSLYLGGAEGGSGISWRMEAVLSTFCVQGTVPDAMRTGAEEGRFSALQELSILGLTPPAITGSSGNKSFIIRLALVSSR